MLQPVTAQSLINLNMQIALEANLHQIACEKGMGSYITQENIKEALDNFALRRSTAGEEYHYQQDMEDSALREAILDVSEAAIDFIILRAEMYDVRERAQFSEEAQHAIDSHADAMNAAKETLEKEVKIFNRYLKNNSTDRETGDPIDQELSVFAEAMQQVAMADDVQEIEMNHNIEAMRQFQIAPRNSAR